MSDLKMIRETIADMLKLILSIFICNMAGVIGSFFTYPGLKVWYRAINKPAFTPPNWVFAPVWTTLFILMGISLFLIWQKGLQNKEVRSALAVFFVQLFFNVLWSAAFFGLRSPAAGLFVIIILWAAILVTILKFYKISMAAGILLIPYILWVSFAAFLNLSIMVLNI